MARQLRCPQHNCHDFIPCVEHPDAWPRPLVDTTPPHPDPRVLHAPGDCTRCDDFSEWQWAWRRWQLPFTAKG